MKALENVMSLREEVRGGPLRRGLAWQSWGGLQRGHAGGGTEQIDGFLSWRNCAFLKNCCHRGATTLPSPNMHTDTMENAWFKAWLDLGRGGNNCHSQT